MTWLTWPLWPRGQGRSQDTRVKQWLWTSLPKYKSDEEHTTCTHDCQSDCQKAEYISIKIAALPSSTGVEPVYTACARASSRTICHRTSSRASSPSSRSGLPEPHAAVPGTGNVSRMPTPRATQARDELGLKPGSHGTPPDGLGLNWGSSLREETGLSGWL